MLLRIFTGYDERESVGWHVFTQSLIDRCSMPVEIIPLTERVAKGLGIGTDGTNAFSLSRFLVPYLSGYKGFALFADGADMLLRADLSELWAETDNMFREAVKVVKHDYRTKHPRKYIGTSMEAANEDYPRKNWSSLVLWNCGHFLNRQITPDLIRQKGGRYLHRFEWLPEDRIGDLSPSWNHLVGEYPESKDANLAHFTLGIPTFTNYTNAEHAAEWRQTLTRANNGD